MAVQFEGSAFVFDPVKTMLWARSVAVVGASPRKGSLGNRVMTELLVGGFDGRVVPVTPSHRAVCEIPAVASLAELDEAFDLVVLAVADSRLEEMMQGVVAGGHRSVVVFSPAHGEASDGTPLRSALGRMARAAGVALCGPNGMGFLNIEHRLRVTGYYMPPALEPGGVTFISHSGSLFAAMAHNRRDLRFNLLVSTGQEVATTADVFLDAALELESTRVVGMFIETIRSVDGMTGSLTRAAQRDVPVVVLKVGSSQRGMAAAATHSGALAGEDSIYAAFFDAHDVRRVAGMDEMVDTLELLSSRRVRPGGVGAVLDSGGERTLLLDTASQFDVPLADISDATRDRLAKVLESGLEPDNPVDAWGTGHGADGIFEETLAALADDPAVGVVVLAVDLTPEDDLDLGYVPMLIRSHRQLPVPVVVMAHSGAAVDPIQSRMLRSEGIPILEGTRSGLLALGHALRSASQRHSVEPASVGPLADRWRRRLASGSPMGEHEALDLLADYGIPTVETRIATTLSETLDAASSLGFPVVVKTAEGIAHKSDVGGVAVGLADVLTVERVYLDMAERHGPAVLVQSLAPTGVEVALGVVVDPDFGPFVMVAAGGRLVELLDNRVLALPPLDSLRASHLLDRLALSRLLDGYRGSDPVDRTGLIAAIVALSQLATDLGDALVGVDVNPLIVGPSGVIAVDALVIPRDRVSPR